MATKNQKLQKIIRRYRDETGETEINMHKVAEFAVRMGWPLPKPADPVDLLAQEFAHAAREEIRYDSVTKRPYRANHAVKVKQGDQQTTFWVDIDEAPRKHMVKSFVMRREQIVDDAVQLTFDAEHWNRIHPSEDPILIDADLTDDVQWRINAPSEEDEKQAS